MIVALIVVVDLLGVAVFAVTRALVASRKRMGIGVAAIAFLAARILEARGRLSHEFGRR